MASKNSKLKKSLENLKRSLDFLKEVDAERTDIAFLSVAKAFEVAVKYAWRHLQQRIECEGLDAPSPKAAVREAARLNIIDNPEAWIDYINARNAGVHDYFGMSNEEYVKITEEFLRDAKKIL